VGEGEGVLFTLTLTLTLSIQLFSDDEHGLSVFHGLQQNSNDYIMNKESEL